MWMGWPTGEKQNPARSLGTAVGVYVMSARSCFIYIYCIERGKSTSTHSIQELVSVYDERTTQRVSVHTHAGELETIYPCQTGGGWTNPLTVAHLAVRERAKTSTIYAEIAARPWASPTLHRRSYLDRHTRKHRVDEREKSRKNTQPKRVAKLAVCPACPGGPAPGGLVVPRRRRRRCCRGNVQYNNRPDPSLPGAPGQQGPPPGVGRSRIKKFLD